MRFKPSSLVRHLFKINYSITLTGRHGLLGFRYCPSTGKNLYTQSIHRPLWEAYERHIKPEDRYCLAKLEKEWERRQPLKGMTVLMNVHLTQITLAMIGVLLKAGATVEVTAAPELVTHPDALQALSAAKILFFLSIPEHKKMNYYHIVYDCGIGIKDLIPQKGKVQLTHTPRSTYDQITCPVIDVNASKTKAIETGFGTGDSVVRVLHEITRRSITAITMNFAQSFNHLSVNRLYLNAFLSLVNSAQLFSQNKFMIFGFGQVGKGIASALESAGAPKKNIFIVEIAAEAYLSAMKNGYPGIWLDPRVSQDHNRQKIKNSLPGIWAVITATGVEGAISQYGSESDFDTIALLINMGTYDEFGRHFSIDRVMNQKKPANFMLDYPTEVMYLDPAFTLFLKAGEELLVNPTLKQGVNPVAPQLDQAVLEDWIGQHGEAVWRHRLGHLETDRLMSDLRRHPAMPLKDLAKLMNNQSIFHSSKSSERASGRSSHPFSH